MDHLDFSQWEPTKVLKQKSNAITVVLWKLLLATVKIRLNQSREQAPVIIQASNNEDLVYNVLVFRCSVVWMI